MDQKNSACAGRTRPDPIKIECFNDLANADAVTAIREAAGAVSDAGLRDLQVNLESSKLKLTIRARR